MCHLVWKRSEAYAGQSSSNAVFVNLFGCKFRKTTIFYEKEILVLNQPKSTSYGDSLHKLIAVLRLANCFRENAANPFIINT